MIIISCRVRPNIMARLGCYNCLRFLVVVVSLLAVVAALCLLCVSTWLVVNMQNSYADIVPVLLGEGCLYLLLLWGVVELSLRPGGWWPSSASACWPSWWARSPL